MTLVAVAAPGQRHQRHAAPAPEGQAPGVALHRGLGPVRQIGDLEHRGVRQAIDHPAQPGAECEPEARLEGAARADGGHGVVDAARDVGGGQGGRWLHHGTSLNAPRGRTGLRSRAVRPRGR